MSSKTMTHLEITHTHTYIYIYIYIDTHIDIQFTFGHFKDIEEMKNFTRDTKFYKQTKKKKKNCTPLIFQFT